MLIEQYDVQITTPPCDPGTPNCVAFVRLHGDIGPALPYLNAAWAGAIFEARAPALNWRAGRHSVVVRPWEIAIGNLADREEAEAAIPQIIGLINAVWERRGEIEPSTAKRPRPTPMGLYQLLPHTNCRACGEGTCFTFAAKLAAGQADLTACAPLADSAHQSQREAIQALLGGPTLR